MLHFQVDGERLEWRHFLCGNTFVALFVDTLALGLGYFLDGDTLRWKIWK